MLFSASIGGAAALPDVTGHWAEDEIRQLVGMGAITGYFDGTYRPENTITRAEFSSVLWGALVLDEAEEVTFPDTDDHWGQGRIEALIQEGVIDAGLYGQFHGPDEFITREEIAMMTVRMLDGGTGATAIPFTDAGEVGTGFREYVAEAYSQGIITGYPDNTFRPSGTATRAEAAVMAIRALRIAGLVEVVDELGELAVHFIDVGQGDAILVQSPTGATMLIDGGPRTAGQRVVEYLKQAGIDSIDKVVATHPHADHIGGLIDVFEAFPVGKVYDSGYPYDTVTFNNYMNIIETKGVEFAIAHRTNPVNLCPELAITIAHPGTTMADPNNSSIVLSLSHGEVGFLFTGDAEREAEQ